MIISFKHKFVFVAVPKTGTHAVRQALRAHLALEDIEQVGLFVQKKLPIPDLAALRMEDPAVFTDTHRLLLRLVGEGKIQGLRIDHPDGLRDPAAYFRRLQDSCLQALGASAIESVRILLNSKSAQHPAGVGGSSGRLGRYLCDHVSYTQVGAVPKEDVEIGLHEDGFDFGGPYVRGVRDDRHLGLIWGDLLADGMLQVFRGAKLRLVDVDPGLIEQATRPGRPLIARIRLTDARVNPICARVHPPYLTWSAAAD